MKEMEVDIETRDGLMNTFITRPDNEKPYPIVLFLMDAPGKREELHDMARRIGSVGYYVMLPNLYYRTARDFVMSSDNREEMFGHMNALSNEMVCDDVQSMFDFSANDSAASGGVAGCVGYCMSGPFAFAAASRFAARIKASASFHGVRLFLDTPESPHLNASNIKGEMYFGCAETDDWAPPEMVEGLDKYLSGTGIKYRIEWYPGTHHGFVFPQRTGIYHKESAERHWERLFDMFSRNLS